MNHIEATRLVDWYDEDGFKEGTKAPHKWVLQAVAELRRLCDENAALRQAIEQAEKQEPVAWHEPEAYGNVTTHKDWALANGWKPLYTTPQTKPLSDVTEALKMIVEEFKQLDLPYGSKAYAKATEVLRSLKHG